MKCLQPGVNHHVGVRLDVSMVAGQQRHTSVREAEVKRSTGNVLIQMRSACTVALLLGCGCSMLVLVYDMLQQCHLALICSA